MFEQIKEILVEEMQLDPKSITMEADLTRDLGMNSLELADLVLICEEHFNVEIKDDEIHKFVCVGDVVNYLSGVA